MCSKWKSVLIHRAWADLARGIECFRELTFVEKLKSLRRVREGKVKSWDGIEIPMSIIHKKRPVLDGGGRHQLCQVADRRSGFSAKQEMIL